MLPFAGELSHRSIRAQPRRPERRRHQRWLSRLPPRRATAGNGGELLRDAGYFTALAGKYKNGYGIGVPAPDGWDFWRGLPSHHLVPGAYAVVEEDGSAHHPQLYQTRFIGKVGVSVIEDHPADQPFFLYLAPTAPHVEALSLWDNDYLCNATPHPNFTGYLAPDRGNFDADPDVEGYSSQDYEPYRCPAYANGYAEMCLRNPDGTPLPGFDLPKLGRPSFDSFDGAPQVVQEKWESLGCDNNLGHLRRLHSERLESMLSVDVMVGKLFAALIDQDELDRTVVIFTSDNGYFLGEHRLGNKGLAYEESIRVPLVIRAIGKRIDAEVRHPAVNIDLAPTVLDLAGLPWHGAAYQIDGRSLRPMLELVSTPFWQWRKAFLIEAEHPRGASLDGPQSWWMFPDYRAVRAIPPYPGAGGSMTYVEFDDPLWPGGYAEDFLYDLGTDPDQIENRVDDAAYQNELTFLRILLGQLESCSGESCREAEAW